MILTSVDACRPVARPTWLGAGINPFFLEIKGPFGSAGFRWIEPIFRIHPFFCVFGSSERLDENKIIKKHRSEWFFIHWLKSTGYHFVWQIHWILARPNSAGCWLDISLLLVCFTTCADTQHTIMTIYSYYHSNLKIQHKYGILEIQIQAI